MYQFNPAIRSFNWSELDGKIFKIRVAEPNPECLELGQVFALDLESGKIYVIAEYGKGDE